MSEERIKKIKDLAREILVLCENIDIPPPSPKAKKETPQSTSFEDIDLEYQDFDILNISVYRIFPVKSGINDITGNTYTKQSIIIKDHAGTERQLIAWDEDSIETLMVLRVGESYDIFHLKNVKQYEQKDGKTVIQYTVGSSTSIEKVSKE